MRCLTLVALLSIAGLFLFSNFDEPTATSSSPNLYVGGSGSGNYTTIQSALQFANNGSKIIIYPGVYHEHLFINKSISLIGLYDVTLDGDNIGNVIHVTAKNVIINGINIRNSGIPSLNTSSNNFSDNASHEIKDENSNDKISGGGKSIKFFNQSINYAGIFIESDNVTVSNCDLYSCYLGIILRNGSNVFMRNCHINNASTGIEIIRSSNDKILSCNISDSINGFLLYYVNDSEVSMCIFSSNDNVGLSLNRVLYTIFHHNTLDGNAFGVILADKCLGNIFYKNNFIGNLNRNVMDNCNNSWDNGLEGNYWSDYNGIDSDGDGIGDTPYYIPLVSVDHYPLMKPVSNTGEEIILNILSPKNNDHVNGTITIEGTVISKSSIKEMKIRIDNETWMPIEGSLSWEKEIDTTKYENGYHDIYVFVVNNDDISTISHLKIYIDNPKMENNSETPGFEMATILLTVFILLTLIFKRKHN